MLIKLICKILHGYNNEPLSCGSLSLYVIFHFFSNNFLITKVVVVAIRQDDINDTYLLFAIVINVIGISSGTSTLI
jgi:hypothetical protein